MRKKDLKRILWSLKNPVKAYKKSIMKSIKAPNFSHEVTMNVNIKQGNKSGVALIPALISTGDYSVDLNPSLIRKKDKKLVKHVDPIDGYDFKKDEKIKNYRVDEKKKVISYNPNNIILEVNKAEKDQGYQMKIDGKVHCKICNMNIDEMIEERVNEFIEGFGIKKD